MVFTVGKKFSDLSWNTEEDYWIDGESYNLDDLIVKGEGQEAIVLDAEPILPGKAIKIFKPLDTFAASDKQAAEKRLNEIEQKLEEMTRFGYPFQLGVAGPERLVADEDGRIVGYVMHHVQGAQSLDSTFRDVQQRKLTLSTVLAIFFSIHKALRALHARGFVVGDFSPRNILVAGEQAWFIDVDSYGFGTFENHLSPGEDFLDPLIAKPGVYPLKVEKRFTKESDRFTFATLLCYALTGVRGFSGGDQRNGTTVVTPRAERPFKKISIFSPGVVLPEASLLRPLQSLPSRLLEEFKKFFEQGKREEFDVGALDPKLWTVCACCNYEHALTGYAQCKNPTYTAQVQTRAPSIAPSTPYVVHFEPVKGSVVSLLVDGRLLRRSDGTLAIPLPGNVLRASLSEKRTILGLTGRVLSVPDPSFDSTPVDHDFDDQPAFALVDDHLFTVRSGELGYQRTVGSSTVIAKGLSQFVLQPVPRGLAVIDLTDATKQSARVRCYDVAGQQLREATKPFVTNGPIIGLQLTALNQEQFVLLIQSKERQRRENQLAIYDNTACLKGMLNVRECVPWKKLSPTDQLPIPVRIFPSERENFFLLLCGDELVEVEWKNNALRSTKRTGNLSLSVGQKLYGLSNGDVAVNNGSVINVL